MFTQFYPISGLNPRSFAKNIRLILFLTLGLLSTTLHAKTYYVSSLGTNSNNGTSAATPWQTIAKVNSFTFALNDIVLFQRGNTFYGGIIVKRSNITFGAYGSGANPVITGLSTVTGWVNLGGNIWEAPVSNVKAGVNLVLRNNTIQQVGRYPNTDAADGGYLTYTKSTNNSITGPALSSTTNWTGAEIAIKVNRWSIARQNVTAHAGGLVTFSTNPDVPRLNYGYFFQRDSRTLDRDGEWWHNVSGKKIRMYFSSNDPGSYTIQVANVDTLLKCQYYSNVAISDLSFSGSGKRSIWINGGSVVSVKNCNVTNSGGEAITVKGTLNVTVDNCTTTNSLGAGINVSHSITGTVNFLVQNCTILNTAYIPGMELSNEAGGEGLKCMGGSGVKILNNRVTNSGYNGIKWQGNNVYVKYNLVDRFCFLRDDGAGIYSWEDASKPETRVNRNVISNIVLNGIGNNQGTNDNYSSVQGLYFDLGSKNVIVDSNTVAYVASNGIHGNNCGSLTFRNNVVFGNSRSFSFQRFAGAELIRNITITNNIVYPYRFRYRNLGINSPSISKESDLKSLGTIDNNYYSQKNGADTSIITVTTYADNSNYKEANLGFSYLTGTVGVEKNSTQFANTGILEYNASSSPKVVNFSGQSKKDVFGKVYNNSVTIPAWSSKVLIPNGTIVANKPPVANAGTNQAINLPTSTVTNSGSLSSDADGTISSYAWLKISGPSTFTIVNSSSVSTAVTSLVQGVYQFQLTVTDNNGATAKDTVQITVNSINSPVANAGPDKSITLPISTTNLTGSGTDADGTISTYGWLKISGPAIGTIVSPLGAATTLLDLVAGVYKYELTVTDDKGASGKDTVLVTVVSSLNLLPAVNPANTVNGLDYKYYEGEWMDLPAFSTLTPVKSGTVANIDLTGAQKSDRFGFTFTGFIKVPSDGIYTFYTSSDDGSQLLIDNVLTVSNGGLHGPVEKSGTIGLKAGKHAITGLFFQRGGGSTFIIKYEASGIAKQSIASSALYRINPLTAARSATGNNMTSARALNLVTTESTSNTLKISSFPNPSSSEFELNTQGGSNEKIAVSAMDVHGRIVFQTTGTTNKIYKLGNNFMPGLYIIKVIQGNNIQTLKVIKI